jgi:hypothetical protein
LLVVVSEDGISCGVDTSWGSTRSNVNRIAHWAGTTNVRGRHLNLVGNSSEQPFGIPSSLCNVVEVIENIVVRVIVLDNTVHFILSMQSVEDTSSIVVEAILPSNAKSAETSLIEILLKVDWCIRCDTSKASCLRSNASASNVFSLDSESVLLIALKSVHCPCPLVKVVECVESKVLSADSFFNLINLVEVSSSLVGDNVASDSGSTIVSSLSPE